MAFIYETRNFEVISADRPLVCRSEGGHVIIYSKDKTIQSLEDLDLERTIERSILVRATGNAMKKVLSSNPHKVDIGILNYQTNGNWSALNGKNPILHTHIFGRSFDAIKQPYGKSLFLPTWEESNGFYDDNLPLEKTDIISMRVRISSLMKYRI